MKKQNHALPPILAALAVLLGSAVALELLCSRYMYLPLFLVAQIVLLLALTTVILGLFGLIPPPVDEIPPVSVSAERRSGILGILQRVCSVVWRGLRRFAAAVGRFVRRRATLLELILLTMLFAVGQLRFIPALQRFTDAAQIGYGTALALLIGSFACIVFDKWCLWAYGAISAEAGGRDRLCRMLLYNLRLTLKIARACALLCAAAIVLCLTGLWDGQRALCYALIFVWGYCSLFLVISIVTRTIRGELRSSPRLAIPLPFAGRQDDDMQILSHLEANTGVTFRSLWSARYIKKILPYTAALTLLFFWLATGLVQVGAYEQGARYRFGRLTENDILGPGLHLTLPWPLDKTVVYDTGHIRELTIGYDSDRQSDNLWTEEHGSNEYRLLLGEGNELVSVNLRLEYVIDDLWRYITAASNPASLLSAEAYELITARTISTNLSDLLSVDRTVLSDELRSELNALLEKNPIGLSVKSVVIENIHPPVEVAAIYQGVVSAEIDADAIVWEAEAKAAVALAQAEASYDSAVQAAEADYYTRVAAARAEVTEFMAAVAADTSHRDAYRYYKYLDALQRSLAGSRLYLLGPDIDAASLYFGGSYVVVNGNN